MAEAVLSSRHAITTNHTAGLDFFPRSRVEWGHLMSRDIRSQATVLDLGDAKPLRSPFSVSFGIEAIPKICYSARNLSTFQPEAPRAIANASGLTSDFLV